MRDKVGTFWYLCKSKPQLQRVVMQAFGICSTKVARQQLRCFQSNLGPGPIRSHPEDWGSAGSRHPKSLKSPLMSCANAAMPSVTDQIPFNRKLLIAMLRSMATI